MNRRFSDSDIMEDGGNNIVEICQKIAFQNRLLTFPIVSAAATGGNGGCCILKHLETVEYYVGKKHSMAA